MYIFPKLFGRLLLAVLMTAGSVVAAPKPLKALLIAGGCCHDYEQQHRILYEGIQKRANVQVDVVWTRDDSHDPPFHLFKNPDWAKGYDVIIHDECAALKKDETELNNVLKAHQTVPAVHLHCAMHSFRGSDNDWTRHVGIKSDRHGPHVPVSVKLVDRKHPIMVPLDDWVTDTEELYNNVDVYGAHALATGSQTYKKGGKDVTDTAIVIWINTEFGAPSFSTSLGHANHTVKDPRYLNLITRGLLWVCGKLDKPAYQQPYVGPNKVTEIPAHPSFVKLSAKSVQAGHAPEEVIDGDSTTRWCANGPIMPTWLQVEFETPRLITGAEIDWEIGNDWMQYIIEVSSDGKKWDRVVDASKNRHAGTRRDAFLGGRFRPRFLRLTVLKQQRDMWPSLYEIRLYGNNGAPLNLATRATKTPALKKKP